MKDKYNIKINPPELSSEQIKQHQNFDALLASFEQPSTATDLEPSLQNGSTPAKKPTRIQYIGLATTTILAASILLLWFRQTLVPTAPHQAPTLQIEELLALQLKQPLPQLAIAVETHIVQAKEGKILTYASGSKVTIPAAAFVDKEGVPVEGAVEITYREFNDPVDMFVAGIPKELNKHQDLQSTGMMEIKGFQNGEPVFLSMDKTLEVALQGKMLTTLNPQDLNVYTYNAKEDIWKYSTKDKVEQKKNTTNKGGIAPNASELATVIAQLQEEKKKTKPQAPIRPGVPDNMQVFDFDIDLEAAPELKKYNQKIDFMASVEDLPPATFDTIWSDMELKSTGRNTYLLTLKYENEQGEVIARTSKVEPVVIATTEAMQVFEQEQKRYQDALENWENEIEQLAEEKLATTTLNSIVNHFEIQHFGLWGCGKPMEWQATASNALPQFVNLEGSTIQVNKVFVANPQQQFYYSASNDAPVEIPFSSQEKIWAMSAEGTLLVAEHFERTEGTLSMRTVPTPNSVADLRALLTL